MKKIIKKALWLIISMIIFPVIKRLAKAFFYFAVLSVLFMAHYLCEALFLLEEAMTSYAISRGILKSNDVQLSGNIGKLKDFLFKNKSITVKAIRDLGYSANKSVNARKNLEKFGIIRTNPQLDNRGEVVANDQEIERILAQISEDIFIPNPVMVN